ncbi:SbcC-like subunit of palindrome specific endonuclease [Synechococcus phage S-MbCM6]|uniref:Gp46 recombination endonuclease n=1 Tax=Synechococcus phage S-MbCM6 TaxID=3126011 RepID=H8ZMM6_9CAUD|nr:SbcC-like subunit of palindrome specific endonuclease [Synechococcus phage ACG-2014c]AFD02737.1 gp46 recombination endonuclease [Synechococcus phage ACG-2014c]
MILFESIRWKNFLSTGDQWTEINLSDSPSTLIVGQNGAGKSTILDVLCFALFNKPFRKINKPQLVNTINEKGLSVEICFSVGRDAYKVFRGIKPNIFEIYKNNKLVDQDAASKDTQKYLEQNVLKLNYKSFTQVVILGSSTFVPFMQLPAAHRREVIEDLLDIGIFSNMNTLLKDKLRIAQSQSRDCDHLLMLAEGKVSAQSKLISSLQEVNQNRQEEKQKKYDENLSLMKKVHEDKTIVEKDIEDTESKIGDYDAAAKTLASFRQGQADKKSELKFFSKDLKFFKGHDVCPTCTQDISNDFKENQVATLVRSGQTLSKEIESFNRDIKEATDIVTQISNQSMKLKELTSNLSSLDRDYVRLEFDNLRIKDEILKLQKDTPSIDNETNYLKEVEDEYAKTQTDCSNISRMIDEYQVVSSLLKDSGIKSQIIKKYIPIFNQLINKYLQSMDFYVNFTLDEEFNEVIKSRFRDEFSYASFSEGEKQKIDLALLFTWREVARMKNSVATNLLILDEVFDSSLDAEGTNELLKILRSLGKDSNVFVISHKGEILVDKFLRTLKFEKVNDFSKLSDDS